MKKSLIVLSLLLLFVMTSCKCRRDWGEWKVSQEKTCETDLVESRKCNKCGILEEKVVELKGHNYSDSYFKRSNGHYQKCLDCGKVSEIEQHIKSNPSETGNIICTKCNYPATACRFPERAIPSVEACGIDVVELARKSGINYNNGPDTVTYFCIILY